MRTADKLTDEPARLAALGRYEVLDTEPESAFDGVTSLIGLVFGAPFVAVSLIGADRHWFKSRQGVPVTEIPLAISFCRHTIREHGAMAVEDATRDGRFADNPLVTGPPHIRSYLGASLTTPDGYNVGALCVLDTAPRRFSESDRVLLGKFASLIVSQLELRQIAARDALTGALARRAFEETVERELARHRRYGTPATLAVFDLDRFRAVNDSHGHAAGDAVLKAAAAACMEAMRGDDRLGRLGGEQFGVLLAGAGPRETAGSLERLRRAVATARAPDHPGIAFTASFGAAACRHDFAAARNWRAAADACLDRAKRAGRNRCVVEAIEPR